VHVRVCANVKSLKDRNAVRAGEGWSPTIP